MPTKTGLPQIKSALADIMINMARDGEQAGHVDHDDAIAALKAKFKKEIAEVTPALVDYALKRLATEVGSRKTRRHTGNDGIDLFGVYHGVPNMMSIGKRKAKDFRLATLEEGRLWLTAHSGMPEIDPDRNKGVELMIADLAPYSKTGKETFAELAKLKAISLGQVAGNA